MALSESQNGFGDHFEGEETVGTRGPKKGMPEMPLRGDPERQATFLQALEESGNFREAARRASPHSEGGCGSTFRNLIRDDPEFAARVQEALGVFRESLVAEAVRRGRDGYDRPIFQKGEQVGTERVYSDNLLLAELRKHFREAYSERHQHDHRVAIAPAGAWQITVEDLSHLSANEKTQLAVLMDKVREGRRERLALEHQPEAVEVEVIDA